MICHLHDTTEMYIRVQPGHGVSVICSDTTSPGKNVG